MKKTYEIDLTGVDTYGEFHNRISAALSFPEYYGCNLDALYDMLTECAEERVITFLHTEEMKEALPSYVEKLQKLFADAVEETEGLQIEFV